MKAIRRGIDTIVRVSSDLLFVVALALAALILVMFLP